MCFESSGERPVGETVEGGYRHYRTIKYRSVCCTHTCRIPLLVGVPVASPSSQSAEHPQNKKCHHLLVQNAILTIPALVSYPDGRVLHPHPTTAITLASGAF